MGISRRKIVIFVLLVTVFIIGVGAAITIGLQNKVLGKAKIIVYAKGKKIVLDPNSPYFRQLQRACEEMLIPINPKGVTPDAYLSPVFYSRGLLKELEEKGWAIEVVYPQDVKTSIKFGVGPTTALEYKITLSKFVVPLSGELINIKKAWGKEVYTYTYLFLFSDLKEPIIATTRSHQKIKNILINKFKILIPECKAPEEKSSVLTGGTGGLVRSWYHDGPTIR